ncbi:MAG: TraR/DksA family transcriptional regulator [Ilumatobacteraceae bacterium]
MEHDDDPTPGTDAAGDATPSTGSPLDLDAIERDLADVETALGRLEAGTYWTDEETGEPLPEHVLEVRPTARRA